MPRIRIAHEYTPDEARRVIDSLIHGYSYKPTAVISRRQRESENALTFGLEVEATFKPSEYSDVAKASAAKCVHDIADGRIYLKRDGSVGYGFEMVSHPATLASHMYDAHWTGIVNKCVKHGMRSHDAKDWDESCGLHIHVGRAQMGATQADRDAVARKVKVLVYQHWDNMVRFSRRKASQLDNWCKRELTTSHLTNLRNAADLDAYAADHIRVSNTHNGRYIAVNCENEATLEFRLFNGTLKRDTLIASMQLCNSIVRYAMTHSMEECLASDFLTVALFEPYNELVSYLQARGLMAVSEDDNDRPQNTNRICRHNGADGLEG